MKLVGANWFKKSKMLLEVVSKPRTWGAFSNIFIQSDIKHCAYIHSVLYFDPIR